MVDNLPLVADQWYYKSIYLTYRFIVGQWDQSQGVGICSDYIKYVCGDGYVTTVVQCVICACGKNCCHGNMKHLSSQM